MLLNGAKNEYDKRIDDEEQMKWLEEWRKRKCWRRKNIDGWKIPKYREQPTTYIYGLHLKGSDQKERIWRVPNSWKGFVDNVQVGDTIFCNTVHGKAPIVVTRIETLNKCPVEFVVKKVASRVIKRNGSVILNGN